MRNDLAHPEIDEGMAGGIETAAAPAPRAEREDRAVLQRPPGLGQAEGEDEDVHLLEHAPDRGQMRLAVCRQFGGGGEGRRLDEGAERIDPAGAVAPLRQPSILARGKTPIGPLDQLEQLQGGVDVGEAGRIDPPARRPPLLLRQPVGAGFGDEVGEAVLPQPAGDVLGEAASGTGDTGVAADRRSDVAGRQIVAGHRIDERTLPIGLRRKGVIGGHSRPSPESVCSTSARVAAGL